MRRITSRLVAALVFSTTIVAGAPSVVAQTAPWPTQPSQNPASGTAPWPSNPPPALLPGPMGAAPMTPVRPRGGGGAAAACNENFDRLSKAAAKRKESADAIMKSGAPLAKKCSAIRGLASALGKFAKYLKDNASTCRFPPQLVQNISQGHAVTLKSSKQCAANLAAAPRRAPAPTLSDALGTTPVPTFDPTTRPRASTGTFDTLTGSPIGQ